MNNPEVKIENLELVNDSLHFDAVINEVRVELMASQEWIEDNVPNYSSSTSDAINLTAIKAYFLKEESEIKKVSVTRAMLDDPTREKLGTINYSRVVNTRFTGITLRNN